VISLTVTFAGRCATLMDADEENIFMDDIATTLPPGARLTAEERARRQAAVDYGRASVRLEGLVMSEYAEDLNRRYVAGEITSAERSAAIRAHYGL
jgi:hypothetical protein